jgi:glycosyltransferase involved in cell wall biosynthesis
MNKVLHLIDSSNLGGVQSLLKGLFEYKNNNNIFLYSLRTTKIKTKIKHKNYYLSNSKNKYSLNDLLKLKKFIKNNKINILHCHQIKSQFFGYLLKILFFSDINLVFHEHGQILLEKPRNITDRFFLNFLKISKNQVNKFIAISNITGEKLISKAKIEKNKMVVLPNFVDLDKFNKKNIKWNIKKEREKLGINKDDFVVGFAGRLVERKGWREFVKAAKILSKKNKKIKFLIAGDGVDRERLISEINKNKLQENIIYLGYFSDMVKFYSLLDCFAMPSHFEAMGLTEIEAQAIGVPVIASDIPGLNEIIIDKKNGLLLKPKNAKDLAEKINIIYRDEKSRNKIILRGLSGVEKYSLDKYVFNLNRVYKKIGNHE